MPDFSVGPGILEEMTRRGDAPVAPSAFWHPVPLKTQETGRGQQATYIWDNFGDSPRLVVLPYETAPSPTLDIEWRGSPNFWQGRNGHPVRAIVLHTAEGTLAGMDAWFATSASQVSAHYGVGLAGAIHQYVKLSDAAWANGVRTSQSRWPFGAASPNYQSVSIETEDNKDPALPVPPAQYAATLALCQMVMSEFPTISHLVAHRAIDTSRSCPGVRWVESGRIVQLAGALGLELVV